MNTKMTKMALALGAMALAGGAMAADDTSTIGVTAQIDAECSVGVGTAIAMAKLTMITADGTQAETTDTKTSTFPAICTNGTTSPKFAYASTNGGTGAFKLMGQTTETELIEYTLHQDAAGAGDTVTASTATTHTSFLANGKPQNLPLTVKVTPTAKAERKVQAYADTITITSTFSVE